MQHDDDREGHGRATVVDTVAAVDVAVVIPNYNGARWLPGVLESVAAQSVAPAEVLVVDDGSTDGSLGLLAERFPAVRVLARRTNGGFARAANAGIGAARAEAVALVNTDVVLAHDWLEHAVAALDGAAGAASVATKLVDRDDPALLYDAGDVLRRDGACEQRGRFERDGGRYDTPGEVFSACAGAALYRRSALLEVGGFDERFGQYLEDVDLGLRLRLAGWACRWEPRAVARHAGGGSSAELRHGPRAWVERNTLLLAARAFRVRWLPQIAYRQLAWTWHAARSGGLHDHLAGVRMALPLLPVMLRERRALRRAAIVRIDEAVPRLPIRGPRAGGHPSRHAR
jgi:GT2 family glycosyltransferase